MSTQDLFLVTLKYTKQDAATQVLKRVSENFLTSAVTFGEAETKMFKHLESNGGNSSFGDVSVTGMKKENFAHIIENEEGGSFFKAGVSYVSVDDKKIKVNFLIEGENIEKVNETLTKYLQETGYNSYQIVNVGVSLIIEVVK